MIPYVEVEPYGSDSDHLGLEADIRSAKGDDWTMLNFNAKYFCIPNTNSMPRRY